jgi:hypothetical protein
MVTAEGKCMLVNGHTAWQKSYSRNGGAAARRRGGAAA